MSKKGKMLTRPRNKSVARLHEINPTKRKVYAFDKNPLTQSKDLSEFHGALIADVVGGRSDFKDFSLLLKATGQVIAHENLKLKAGVYKTKGGARFLLNA